MGLRQFLCCKSCQKQEQEEIRKVFLNGIEPSSIRTEPLPNYPDNRIKTYKYTWLTFLPKNLFEQFRRIANFYFLIIIFIQLGIDSPVPVTTSILPLVFVVAVTGVKQGYEDWKRHREDNKINNSEVIVLKDGRCKSQKNCDIKVGDIVKVSINEQFPCDLLLLSTPRPDAMCDVTTANLDGETNLKKFVCCSGTSNIHSEDELWQYKAEIECQPPQANLYDYKGRMTSHDPSGELCTTSLNTEHLLLRGARLVNTEYIYGCAIYTGEDTKMALNSKMKNGRSKFSTVETSLNYFLIFYLVFLLTETIICTVIKYTIYGTEFSATLEYMDAEEEVTAKTVFQDGFSFLVLFNYVIPISLYVTLEVQKFLGSIFFSWDVKFICDKTGEKPKCNTSDISEELGQIEYLFSDKTGTLTENIMEFRQCSVGGEKLSDVDGRLQYMDENNNSTSPIPSTMKNQVDEFLVTLALCHTVQVSRKHKDVSQNDDGIALSSIESEYQASSPDEKALVEATERNGVIFTGIKDEILTLNIHGKEFTYKRLHVFEFDSDRKLMSVLIRDDATNKIWLLCKGAESSILKRCRSTSDAEQGLADTTLQHIDHFALLGLRTLAVAKRELSEEEFIKLKEDITKAQQELDGRDEALQAIMSREEANLSLQGATGVEDLLQDGVQETLESLRMAGIKVWVLTGDKVETAVNIAYSCGQFKRTMYIFSITGHTETSTAKNSLQEIISETQDADQMYGLAVDGMSITLLLDEELKHDFLTVCSRCSSVVCCRMSPSQKSQVVNLVKTSKLRPICAAIGDGANDVPMIQEAHIGIGLMGKEGRQAVRCADFAFGRFKFLKRLLLVHGQWYYIRVSYLVQYSFYKNLAFITPQVLYAIWNAFSTQTLYESFFLTMYNITFTFLPVIVFGLFEQNYSDAMLMSRPHLYTKISKNRHMSTVRFVWWFLSGLWTSCVLFFGFFLANWNDTSLLPGGHTPDRTIIATTIVTTCVFVVNIKIVLESQNQTAFFIGSVILTLVGYVVQALFYSGILLDFFENYDGYWSYYRMFECSSMMLSSVLLGVVCLIPDIIVHAISNSMDRDVMLKKDLRLKTSWTTYLNRGKNKIYSLRT